jgi:hypothetical protein
MGGDLDVASVPGSGSAFVLVLPGPADAPHDAIQETLRRALEDEEIALEERLVRRAIAAGEQGPGGSPAELAGGSRRAGQARLRALPSIHPDQQLRP